MQPFYPELSNEPPPLDCWGAEGAGAGCAGAGDGELDGAGEGAEGVAAGAASTVGVGAGAEGVWIGAAGADGRAWTTGGGGAMTLIAAAFAIGEAPLSDTGISALPGATCRVDAARTPEALCGGVELALVARPIAKNAANTASAHNTTTAH